MQLLIIIVSLLATILFYYNYSVTSYNVTSGILEAFTVSSLNTSCDKICNGSNFVNCSFTCSKDTIDLYVITMTYKYTDTTTNSSTYCTAKSRAYDTYDIIDKIHTIKIGSQALVHPDKNGNTCITNDNLFNPISNIMDFFMSSSLDANSSNLRNETIQTKETSDNDTITIVFIGFILCIAIISVIVASFNRTNKHINKTTAPMSMMNIYNIV